MVALSRSRAAVILSSRSTVSGSLCGLGSMSAGMVGADEPGCHAYLETEVEISSPPSMFRQGIKTARLSGAGGRSPSPPCYGRVRKPVLATGLGMLQSL